MFRRNQPKNLNLGRGECVLGDEGVLEREKEKG
jgi:hypothetical protein